MIQYSQIKKKKTCKNESAPLATLSREPVFKFNLNVLSRQENEFKCSLPFRQYLLWVLTTDINYIRTLLYIINNFISSKSYFQFLLAYCQQVARHGLQIKTVIIINNKNVKHKQIILYYFITFLFFVFRLVSLIRIGCKLLVPMYFIQIYRPIIKTMKYLYNH